MVKRSVLVLAMTMLAAPAVAQDTTNTWSEVNISDVLSTVTVLDDAGALGTGEVARLNADGLDLMQANGEERHFTVAKVRRLETIGRDSIKNGGLIGAGLGAGLGAVGAEERFGLKEIGKDFKKLWLRISLSQLEFMNNQVLYIL